MAETYESVERERNALRSKCALMEKGLRSALEVDSDDNTDLLIKVYDIINDTLKSLDTAQEPKE